MLQRRKTPKFAASAPRNDNGIGARNSSAKQSSTNSTLIGFALGVIVTIIANSFEFELSPNSYTYMQENQNLATATATHSENNASANQNRNSNDFHAVSIYSKATETQPIETKSTYSQAKQDLIVLAMMKANDEKVAKNGHGENANANAALRTTNNNKSDKSGKKYFVDLAANDAIVLSNSYLLEKHGWDGLCLEPNPMYWYRLASYRTCNIVGAFVGGKAQEDGKEVDVVLSNGVFGGIAGEGMDNKKEASQEKRNLVSIFTVFQEHNVPTTIDYFSLDVEGAETIVMNDFPWHKYKFKFMTIERPKDDLKVMLVKNGYKQVVDITTWGETLWIHEASVALTQADIDAVMDQQGLRCGRWIHQKCEFAAPSSST